MLRKTKSIGLVFFMCTALVVVPSSFAQEDDAKDLPTPQSITAEDMTSLDITDTDEGQRQAAEAIKRWSTEYGMKIRPDEVTVLNLGTAEEPDILVMSNGDTFKSASTTVAPDGTVTVDTQMSTATAPPDTAISEEPIETQSQSWDMVADKCQSREQGTTGWIDQCYHLYRLQGDNSSSKDYYQLAHFATASSKAPFFLISAQVESIRQSHTARMEWVDWSPRSDLDFGGCNNINIGITHGAATLDLGYNVCETWNITKYSEAGRFKNKWQQGFFPAVNQEREIAYAVEVSVDEGEWPVWDLEYSYVAY